MLCELVSTSATGCMFSAATTGKQRGRRFVGRSGVECFEDDCAVLLTGSSSCDYVDDPVTRPLPLEPIMRAMCCQIHGAAQDDAGYCPIGEHERKPQRIDRRERAAYSSFATKSMLIERTVRCTLTSKGLRAMEVCYRLTHHFSLAWWRGHEGDRVLSGIVRDPADV